MCRSDPKPSDVSRWFVRTYFRGRCEISWRNYYRKRLVVHARQQASSERRPISGSLPLAAEFHGDSAREIEPQAGRILTQLGAADFDKLQKSRDVEQDREGPRIIWHLDHGRGRGLRLLLALGPLESSED